MNTPGIIIGCKINTPGSWHDARIARTIYEKLLKETPDGYYLVTDTAFPRGPEEIEGHIRAPMKSGQRLPGNPEMCKQIERVDRQLLSFRQSAEWGMRQLQGSFGRLRIPLEVNDAVRRGDMLETCVRLQNLRTKLVGINKLQSVYLPIWQENVEQEEIWSNFENIVYGDQRKHDRVAKFHLIY